MSAAWSISVAHSFVLLLQDPATGRIDARRAVKTFHRPAAGDEMPLPSDVRPPDTLKVKIRL